MADEENKARLFAVRALGLEDIFAVLALERATEHAPHWRRKEYAEMARDMGLAGHSDLKRHIAVAKQADGQVVGFAVGWAHPGLPDSAVLESVCVAAAARRSGVGRAVCEDVFAWCRRQGATEIGLEVRAGNAAALALYGRLGFVEAGRRRGYYADPVEDAVLLRLSFTRS